MIAQLQVSDTVAAARIGVEIALASATDWVAAVPEFSAEVLTTEMNAAASVIRAAFEASQTAAGDVSVLTRELGELLAEIRSESVGQLVRLAIVSPMTWILLGIVVAISAEIARREIRHAAEGPPGAGDPDLLASWGTL